MKEDNKPPRRTRQPPAAGFPRARAYADRIGTPRAGVARERPPRADEDAFSERHLQCVWYDPALRPDPMLTDRGEPVRVEHPGRWNLEAGPDFLDAVLCVGPERRYFRGDVEIHRHAEDWCRHAHDGDPRYRRVIAHVSFYPATRAIDGLPPHAVRISLAHSMRQNPRFSFEAIDVAAYPYPARYPPAPCGAAMAGWSIEEKTAFVESAGEARLQRKADRLAEAMARRGEEQALYEEIMAALGYRENRHAFRRIAQQVPLSALGEETRGDPTAAMALFLGVSGLMPARLSPRWDEETRAYLRSLWDHWWKGRARWEAAVLPPGSWVLSNLRPANHPVRRLAAAAAWFGGAPSLPARLAALNLSSPEGWIRDALALLQQTGMPYWSRRLSFSRAPLEEPVSLVGADRAAAILCNVLVPHLAAAGRLQAPAAVLLNRLPPGQDAGLMRQTAFVLFGADHHPRHLRTALRRQGLLQVFHDFCLTDRSGCRECPLPGLLAKGGRASIAEA